MKKTLLLAIGVGVAVTANAQTNYKATKGVSKAKTVTTNTVNENLSPLKRETKTPVRNTSDRRSFGRTQLGTYSATKISSSANCYGLLVSGSTSLTANKDLKTIVFNNRGTADTKPTGWTSGWLTAKFSKDYGVTWDSVVVYNSTAFTYNPRYPATFILNDAGNTDFTKARIASTGPSTAGAGWDCFHRSTVSFDGNNRVNEQIFYTDPGVMPNQFPRNGGDASNNVGHVMGVLEDNVDGTTLVARGFRGSVLNTATLNSDGSVTWKYDSIGTGYAIDGTGDYVGYETPVAAWSADGQTGYIVNFGVEQNTPAGQNLSFQPIVWKTTNAGATWTKELVNYDWSSTQLDELYLQAAGENGGSGIVKPFFSMAHGIDAVVDANNDLHLLTELRAGSSLSLDSAGYTWSPTNYAAMMFDVATKTIGGQIQWCASYVDLIYANYSTDAENDYGDMTLDSRIQISASEDRTKLFYTWVDTDTTLAGGFNNYPDLFVKGRDLTSNNWTETYMISDDNGNAFWHYTSDVTLTNANGDYVLPITIGEDNFAFLSTGYHNINYVSNAILTNAMFTISEATDTTITSCGDSRPTGLNKNSSKSLAVVLAPNPTSTNSNLTVTLPASSNITVNVYNTLGSVVKTLNMNGVEGTNNLTISLENLASGVYTYNVSTSFGSNNGKILLMNK